MPHSQFRCNGCIVICALGELLSIRQADARTLAHWSLLSALALGEVYYVNSGEDKWESLVVLEYGR